MGQSSSQKLGECILDLRKVETRQMWHKVRTKRKKKRLPKGHGKCSTTLNSDDIHTLTECEPTELILNDKWRARLLENSSCQTRLTGDLKTKQKGLIETMAGCPCQPLREIKKIFSTIETLAEHNI